MQQVFVPKICKDQDGEPAAFDGSILIEMPLYEQTLVYQSYLDMDPVIGDDGEVDVDATQKKAASKGMHIIRKMAPHVKEHVVKVDLTRKSDGYKFDSYEKMQSSKDCFGAIADLSMKLVNGLELGKS